MVRAAEQISRTEFDYSMYSFYVGVNKSSHMILHNEHTIKSQGLFSHGQKRAAVCSPHQI
jgi:recombinational DNA repair ATPase RecF